MPSPIHQLSLPQFKLSDIVTWHSFSHCYRQGGFRLQQQSIAGKQVFHNYGQGDAEYSLSYGCSYITSKIITVKQDATKIKEVAVLGCGINALMTTLELLKRGYKVNLYARVLPVQRKNSSSKTVHPQQGLKIWYNGGYDNCDPLKHELVSKLSYQFLKECLQANRYQSLKWVTCYCSGAKDIRSDVTEYINDEIGQVQVGFGVEKVEQFTAYRTIMIDTRLFMEEIFTELKLRNVFIVQKQFNSLEDVLGIGQKYIFNCLGLESKHIFNDLSIRETKGCYYTINKQPNPLAQPLALWVSSQVQQQQYTIAVSGNRMEISIQSAQTQTIDKIKQIGDRILTRAYHFIKQRTIRPHKL